MKKYSSGSFVDAAVRVYGSEADTINSFPASIIADGENISAMSISGNLIQPSTPTLTNPVYPSECGDLVASGEHSGEYVFPVISGGVTTNIYTTEPLRKIGNHADIIISNNTIQKNINTITVTGNNIGGFEERENCNVIKIIIADLKDESTANLFLSSHFFAATYDTQAAGALWNRRYNYYNVEMGLPKSITTFDDAKNWFNAQIANNTPVIIYFALIETITSSITFPIIPTTSGSQSFTIDTTLKPSSVSLTYTGWHTHSDKQYSGGSWGAVTSGQILRRKRTTKRKT